MPAKICTRCRRPFKGKRCNRPDCNRRRLAELDRETRRRDATEPDRAIRASSEWDATRKRVRRRDGNRCTYGMYVGDAPQPRCRATTKLDVHHIVRPEDGGAPFGDENCRTLCTRHHARVEAQARAARRREEER